MVAGIYTHRLASPVFEIWIVRAAQLKPVENHIRTGIDVNGIGAAVIMNVGLAFILRFEDDGLCGCPVQFPNKRKPAVCLIIGSIQENKAVPCFQFPDRFC